MSSYHPNVTWQCPDGTWGVGFFTVVVQAYVSDSLDDPDELDEDDVDEWGDSEVDEGSFESCATGFPDPHAAMLAATRDRPNPGATEEVRRDQAPDECARYDVMAAACTRHVRP